MHTHPALAFHSRAASAAQVRVRIGAAVAAAVLASVPGGAAAAVLTAVPAQSAVSVGDTVTVRIVVDSEGVAINNAEARLSYPSALLEPISVTKTGSIFTLWIEDPSYAAATVSFNGGVPTPGFTGSNGTAMTATFRAKAAGTASLAFGDAAVRANDGSGTDVLRSAVGTAVTIAAPAETPQKQAPQKTPAATPAQAGPVGITSDTHPDQTKWYAARDVRALFQLPPGTTAIQILTSRQKNATPTVTYDPPIRDKRITALDDGTWYVYARAKTSGGWGATAAYTIRIDGTAPVIEGLGFGYDATAHALAFTGTATDALSGVASYEVRVDGGEPSIIGPDGIAAARIAGGAAGTHAAQVRVVDAAGNAATKELTYEVAGIPAPQLTGYPHEAAAADQVIVTGTAMPGSVVTVHARRTDGIESTATADATAGGMFSASIDGLDAGAYELWAESMLPGGPASAPSPRVPLTVTGHAFLRIGAFALSNTAATAVVALLLVLSIAFGFSEWFRSRRARGGAHASRHAVRPAHSHGSREGVHLAAVERTSDSEDLSATYRLLLKYVRYLDDVAKRRALTPEEAHLRAALEADLRRVR